MGLSLRGRSRNFLRKCPRWSTLLAYLKKPLSLVWRVLQARGEGLGENATARTFGLSKNTVRDWEQRCADLKPVLFLYSLAHAFLYLSNKYCFWDRVMIENRLNKINGLRGRFSGGFWDTLFWGADGADVCAAHSAGVSGFTMGSHKIWGGEET